MRLCNLNSIRRLSLDHRRHITKNSQKPGKTNGRNLRKDEQTCDRCQVNKTEQHRFTLYNEIVDI